MRHLQLNAEVGLLGKDGFYRLEKDQEAIEAFIEEEVERRTKAFPSRRARYEFLFENDYYTNFIEAFDTYDWAFIESLHDYAESFDFKYKSYMAISKFYKDYVLKTNDGKEYLEDYADHAIRVALALAKGDRELATQAVWGMMTQKFQPATPTFMNAGLVRGGQMTSCFLLEVDDSLNSINYVEAVARQLSKAGGGVGINITNLRPKGSVILGREGISSGVIPFCKSLEQTFSWINQLGTRPGSGVPYLSVHHMDIIDFLSTKKVNADEKLRLATLNIGVIIPDIFMELAERDEAFYTFDAYYVKKETGVSMAELDMSKHYYELVANPNIRKKKMDISPRELLNNIAKTQFESGYPYIMFIDNANAGHANENISRIKMSNLCSEILQAQTPSVIGNMDEDGHLIDSEIGMDISCNLASFVIDNLMDDPQDFESAVDLGVRILSNVSESLNVPSAPSVMKGNREMRAIGLGAMNLHGFFAKNGIVYGSHESIDFTSTFFMMLNYYSLKSSSRLAVEKGSRYHGFEGSTYADGSYFDKYLEYDFTPATPRIQKIFEDFPVPTKADWAALKETVMRDGLYNSYRLTIPPTGSISYVTSSTASIMPVTELVESREYGNAKTYYAMPYYNQRTQWIYKTAFQMDMKDMLNVVRAAQEHIDQGISTTLFFNGTTKTNHVAESYIYAWKLGLKTLYYTRIMHEDRASEAAVCVACSV